VSAPLVILGLDLRVRRFSTAARALLHLIDDDVGRPLSYLSASLQAPQLDALVEEVTRTGRERTQRMRCSDGLWYSARVTAYRTDNGTVRGAVLEFMRLAPARHISETPEVGELTGKILSTLPHVLMLLDDELRLLWVNRAFFDTFAVGAEVLGQSLDSLWPERANERAFSTALEETASGAREGFAPLDVGRPMGRKDRKPMRFSGRRITAEGDRASATLVVIEEARGAQS
jgi:two-component system CheB/CheR fusion protein